ncbi:unnamed protein product [Chondrus crispus]|uniref:Uncharacterized protein n=1 Tax=Chondrus crispus TaxID=2769 RepID=R7QKR9_CHOCR|nr:unnamed protein product [Chondrus crispus]CDF38679.1 unnamed protein product [Chondrus crispus]|eukprot:XP_005718584.1 unnamed protein product [Chondrus crispus]
MARTGALERVVSVLLLDRILFLNVFFHMRRRRRLVKLKHDDDTVIFLEIENDAETAKRLFRRLWGIKAMPLAPLISLCFDTVGLGRAQKVNSSYQGH